MNRQDWIAIVVVVVVIFLALFAAYYFGGWNVTSLVVIVTVLSGAYFFLRKWSQASSGTISTSVAQHLKTRLDDFITKAEQRVTDARQTLTSKETARTTAQSEADGNPGDATKVTKLRQAQREFDEAKAKVDFEEAQRARLLHTSQSQGGVDRETWMTVLQYVVFGSLAWYVLHNLLEALTKSPLPGTPRNIITSLISVVTVGIALILVLYSIVSERVDEK
jgi:hypothetical protein